MRRAARQSFTVLGAIAAAALALTLGVPSSHAQNQNDPRYQKKQQQRKGPVQAPRRGPAPNAMMPQQRQMTNRPGFGPIHGPAQGAHPQTHNAGPGNAKNMGPGSRFSNAPGAFGKNQGQFGNRPGQFGNRQGQFGNRQGPFGRGFTNRDPRRRAVNAASPQMRQTQRFSHRSEMFAVRARMPFFPLPGERNFTGVPPLTEMRYVETEMVCQWDDITPERIEEIARQHNLTIVSTQRSALTGATLVRFRIGGNRPSRDVVRAMEAERIVSQPNYIYYLGQQNDSAETAAAKSAQSAAETQYVANKLRLADVHKIATGKDVIVAVIDSEIDRSHPELAKGIAERYDAVGKADQPHLHGTGMAGAIVSQDRLMGVAPGARMLAVHAFSTGAVQQTPQATTQSIVAGVDWALSKGARIINMSFAGPPDPILALHLKKASEKGAILIAAVGNAGPKSPPLYPGADPRVIGVTAIDENDQVYSGANVGAQVAIAAPGVDVMVPAPSGAYQLTTGTSVAAAHVSGVVALLLEKYPQADAQLILEVLTSSATRLGYKRDDKVGWGLIDPLAALSELDARLADNRIASAPASPVPTNAQAAAPARAPAAQAAAPARAQAPAAAATRSALPRPGIYVPKQ